MAEAEAALAGGQPNPELWARCAELWDDLERPYRAASARREEAEARLLTGDRAGAQDVARRGHEAAVRLGAAWLQEAIEGLARRGRLRLGTEERASSAAAAGPGGAAVSPPSPADELGLTPRELEVLLLVTEGRTNREIGERLFMAEKTASVHVSRILAKLGVRSRTEAATAAHRLGLVAGAGRV